MKRDKRIVYSEYVYFFGVFFSSLSSALLAKSGMGVSLSSAPSFVLYVKSSITQPVTFGICEYTLQTFLLVILYLLVRKRGKTFLFSLATTLLYAFMLDGLLNILNLIPLNMFMRILYVFAASLLGPVSMAFLSHTYISPYAYTFFAEEMNGKFNMSEKAVFWSMYAFEGLLGLGLSFYFFGVGRFAGVSIRSLVYTLSSIFLLRPCEHSIENYFKFRDKFPQLKRHF